MLLKLPLLFVLFFIFVKTKYSILCAAIWSIVIFVFQALVLEELALGLFLIAGVRFLLAFAYFALLESTENTAWWWPVLFIGGGIIVFV